jgi:hypothetical protein
MKRRKKKPHDLLSLFESTCGWCGKGIPPNTEVFGGGGKARPGVDLSGLAGQITALYLAGVDKTVLVGIAGLDSEAKRDGQDFVYLTCSQACGSALRAALQDEISRGNQMGLD